MPQFSRKPAVETRFVVFGDGQRTSAPIQAASRKIDRPEDDPDGEIAEGAGELGFFPASSIWPLWTALTMALIVLGPVFGWWITLIGFSMGVLAGMNANIRPGHDRGQGLRSAWPRRRGLRLRPWVIPKCLV